MKNVLISRLFAVIIMACVATTATAQNLPSFKKKEKNENASSSPVVTLSQHAAQVNNSSNPVQLQLNALVKKGILNQADIAYVVTSDHVSRTSGIHHYYLLQAIEGIGVYGTETAIHISSSGSVIKSDMGFIQDIQNQIYSRAASISSEEAIQRVASQMNYQITNLSRVSTSSEANQKTIYNGAGISNIDIPVSLAYYYQKDIGVTKIWELSIQEIHSSDWWNFRVDATTGQIIDKDNWTVSCNILGDHDSHTHENNSNDLEFCEQNEQHPANTVLNESEAMIPTYQVYALPLRSPYSGGRTNEVNPQNATASPLGWHDTGSATYTRTQGNNVRCYDDDNNTNSPSNTSDYAEGGAGLVFQFPLENTNGSGEPVYSNANQSEDAAVSHLFYISNVIHDVIFQYGMDEAGGAFQENNFGNGGVGGDSVDAEAQDGSGTCNANFGTPADGGNPRMQMYTCGDRDASFDNEVVIHEYAHGISNRLTGGPGAAGCLGNTEQMGEGWSDYYGLMLTMIATESDTDSRGMGNWLNGGGINGAGIRTHPYSTDFGVNPHTYDDINTEVAPHGVGSVWAMMLWEMTWEIMNKYETASGNGFDADLYTITGNANTDAGNIQALAIVTEGLALQACSPGFIDGRDAILLADQNIYGGANQCEIWAAFARRGLGFSADQGSSASKTDGTEAFDLPPNTALIEVSTNQLCEVDGTQNSLSGGLPSGGTYSGPGVTDNADGSTFTFDPVAAGPGTHTITYNVTDGCSGLVVDVTDTIVVEDGTPDMVCEDITVQLDATGNATVVWQDVVSGADVLPGQYVVETFATATETLTGAATSLSLGDDAITGAIPIGFDFDLYGETTTDFYVCSNGFIYFTPNTGMTAAQSRTAQTLPSADIPNGLVALFMDDLDPSAGGNIRYELFGTAPNRKLVVEFDAVPYWNTTITNTGQIHIYEGTNVVETHIVEAGSDGNKTLGVESIDGNNGITHPQTNNSGWNVGAPGLNIRFTPTPTSFADNCGNSVALSLSKSTFTCLDIGENEVIVTADDGNGGVTTCTTTITIEPNPAQLTTYNGSWSNSAPTSTSVAVFAGDYNTATADIEACSCIVNSGATVTVGAGEYLRSQGNITVDGNLIVEHQGSVVQVDPLASVTKTGTINVEVTTPVLQTRDFMVMGSPMDVETRTGVFNSAFLVLSHDPNMFNPNTHPNIPQGATNFKDLEGDFWTSYGGGITPGEGYIVRPQSGYSDPANTTFDMTYSLGTLNNGTFNRSVIYDAVNSPSGTPNVYSNPYASAIDADMFIQDNGLDALYFWEHLTPPSVIVPGQGLMFDMDDVSIRNFGGGVAANNDNPLNMPTGVISTGQGFAIKATNTSNPSVSFTNDMRLTTGNTTLRSNEPAVDRLWLHLESTTYGLANNLLIGFNPSATNGWDTGYDTDRLASSVGLYSHLDSGDAQMAIQTRGAFVSSDKIQLGFSSLIEERTAYTISLSNVEGTSLTNRAIYLYDSYENTLTDLTQGDYTFRSDAGVNDRRFTVLFDQDGVLANDETALENISMFPNPTRNVLNIIAPGTTIEQLEVYDVRGRVITTINTDGVQRYQLDMSGLDTAMYFVAITTPDGMVTKRIVKE